MRKFSSYGPCNKRLHYYVPREELIQKAYQQLVGEDPDEGGHYITVWAPRQRGKTWIMNEVMEKLRHDERFLVGMISLQSAKTIETDEKLLRFFLRKLQETFPIELPEINDWDNFTSIFTRSYCEKPVILILDEFDALAEDFINKFANEFRDMFIQRRTESHKPSHEKKYLLHGLALIGVRSVLGVENLKGSPFNVQRSLHVPNLTHAEVDGMFQWYEQESGQAVEQAVIDRLYYETQGQPGLVSWFGELLTEGFEFFQPDSSIPLTLKEFDEVFLGAVDFLPNNNIINIISKAKQSPHKNVVLELFKTKNKVGFKFDDTKCNFLYMNGVIDVEKNSEGYWIKFPCPFVQKRLFNFFSHQLFHEMGDIFEPFTDISDTITEHDLNIKNLIRRYEQHLRKNRDWMLKDAPRRKDLKIFEAVFHFNLYEYLNRFLTHKKGRVLPEFPTGNGTVDLIIRYAGKTFALELKSFTDEGAFKEAQTQASRYARSLGLNQIFLIVFVESIPDDYRLKYEVDYTDEETGVIVSPVFAAIGA